MASLDWEPLAGRRLGLIGVAVSASVNNISLLYNDEPGTNTSRSSRFQSSSSRSSHRSVVGLSTGIGDSLPVKEFRMRREVRDSCALPGDYYYGISC